MSFQILWFLLYIGGERIFLKILHHVHVYISKNNSLTPEAQSSLLQLIKSIENNKDLIYKCHQVAFYLNGKYYSIANRITGIRYVSRITIKSLHFYIVPYFTDVS